MKKLLVAALSAALITGAASTALAQKPRIEKRKDRQQKRVADGVADGSLTPRETARIEAKEARLNREIRKDRKDGGGLTPKERVKIERKQDKLSREIAKEKHDAQKQK
jgi:hypothetical protein